MTLLNIINLKMTAVVLIPDYLIAPKTAGEEMALPLYVPYRNEED